MKRALLVIVLLAVAVGAAVLWRKNHPAAAKALEEKPPAEEARVKHDDKGQVIINMDDEAQGDIGIVVTNPVAMHLAPELKGYGRMVDPAPLAALGTELATAAAAYVASSNELTRLKTLAGQGNASARALQTAEASARRDQIVIQSVRDRLALSWGREIAGRDDSMSFIQSLTSQEAALVRIDLPAGQSLKSPPAGARITTLKGDSAEAEFLGMAAGIDPQTQSRGFIFLIKTNQLGLLSGEAVTGHLKLAGEPLSGVIIPRDAIVRTEGKSWIYVLNEGGEAFTRKEIALDRPVESGWFIEHGVSPGDYVVVTGAQTLLSEESKAPSKPD